VAISLPCSGTLRPLVSLQPGEKTKCGFCRVTLRVVPPPPGRCGDPWAGNTAPRVEVHDLAWREPPMA